MNLKRIIAGIAAVIVVAVGASACGTVVKTGQGNQALWYEDGAYSAQKFKGCITPGQRDREGIGDKMYYYPSGQRTYSFTGLPGAERQPITIATKDSQQMTVSGFITFDLTQDCKTLKKFHEQIGLKYKAYFTDGNQTENDGWNRFLNDYVDVPLNVVLNNAGLDFNWQDMWTNPAILKQFNDEIDQKIADQINQTIGIPGVITVRDVNTQKPRPSDELLQTIQKVQQAKAQGQADRAKVDQERQTQADKTKLEQDKLATRAQCKKVYTQDECFWIEIQNGPNPPDFYPVPQGGNINITPNK